MAPTKRKTVLQTNKKKMVNDGEVEDPVTSSQKTSAQEIRKTVLKMKKEKLSSVYATQKV